MTELAAQAAGGPADPAALGAYSLPYLDMLVVFDDGLRLDSHADQRDMRRAQVAMAGPVAGSDRVHEGVGVGVPAPHRGVVDGLAGLRRRRVVRDPVGGADGRGPYTEGVGLMVGRLAVRLGIAPSILWDEDPRDLATLISLLADG